MCQGYNEQGSLMKTDTVLITPFSPKALAGVIVLTIIDSLFLRFTKLIDEDTSYQNSKPWPPLLSPIPSTYYHYFHTLETPSKDLTCPW